MFLLWISHRSAHPEAFKWVLILLTQAGFENGNCRKGGGLASSMGCYGMAKSFSPNWSPLNANLWSWCKRTCSATNPFSLWVAFAPYISLASSLCLGCKVKNTVLPAFHQTSLYRGSPHFFAKQEVPLSKLLRQQSPIYISVHICTKTCEIKM